MGGGKESAKVYILCILILKNVFAQNKAFLKLSLVKYSFHGKYFPPKQTEPRRTSRELWLFINQNSRAIRNKRRGQNTADDERCPLKIKPSRSQRSEKHPKTTLWYWKSKDLTWNKFNPMSSKPLRRPNQMISCQNHRNYNTELQETKHITKYTSAHTNILTYVCESF